jgi:hypothetical protein
MFVERQLQRLREEAEPPLHRSGRRFHVAPRSRPPQHLHVQHAQSQAQLLQPLRSAEFLHSALQSGRNRSHAALPRSGHRPARQHPQVRRNQLGTEHGTLPADQRFLFQQKIELAAEVQILKVSAIFIMMKINK